MLTHPPDLSSNVNPLPFLGIIIGLVCNGIVIDRIACPQPSTGEPPANSKQEQDQAAFEALSNQRQNNGQQKIDRLVIMQLPCPPKLPENCTAEAEEDEEAESVADESDPQLESENNNKHHHHRKDQHHQKDNSHHKPKKNKKKNKHPYQDLCVATGDFYGSQLYSCDSVADTLYSCSSVGEMPIPKQDKGRVRPPIDPPSTAGGCTCPGSVPVCGSDLPAECKGEPNSIYHCPDGKGSRPHVLRMCNPGSLCRATSQTTDPVCGFQNCNCTGSSQVCSNQFPDSCGLPKNVVLQCDASNKKVVVKECSHSQVCTTVGNKATCAADTCKCSSDGAVCGEVFPLSCRISAVALYSCKVGGAPVITKKCSPGRCSGTIRDNFQNSVIHSQVDDTCRDACQCTTDGQVTFLHFCQWSCASLFLPQILTHPLFSIPNRPVQAPSPKSVTSPGIHCTTVVEQARRLL